MVEVKVVQLVLVLVKAEKRQMMELELEEAGLAVKSMWIKMTMVQVVEQVT